MLLFIAGSGAGGFGGPSLGSPQNSCSLGLPPHRQPLPSSRSSRPGLSGRIRRGKRPATLPIVLAATPLVPQTRPQGWHRGDSSCSSSSARSRPSHPLGASPARSSERGRDASPLHSTGSGAVCPLLASHRGHREHPETPRLLLVHHALRKGKSGLFTGLHSQRARGRWESACPRRRGDRGGAGEP